MKKAISQQCNNIYVIILQLVENKYNTPTVIVAVC